jgi:hypothetical protein
MQGIATILICPESLSISLLERIDHVLDAISGKLLQGFLIRYLSFVLNLMKSLQLEHVSPWRKSSR